jgi:hypothetical protein
MAIKNLHQFFYYHSKYLNNMKYREISIDPFIHIIRCRTISILDLTSCFQVCYTYHPSGDFSYLKFIFRLVVFLNPFIILFHI